MAAGTGSRESTREIGDAARVPAQQDVRAVGHVTVRSELARSVKQATPSAVVSSCTIPASVTTAPAPHLSDSDAR